VLKPKGDECDGIVIYGHSGNISLDAMRWLSKQNIPLTILNWDGRVLTNVLIPEMKQGVIRMAQYDAYRDGRRLVIAKAIIDAKISSSIKVLDWVVSRYPEVKDTCQAQFDELEKFRPFLATARTPKEVMGIEGMVARNYWLIVQEVIDDKFCFEGRVVGKAGKPMGAVDPVNVLFNYGYAMLETQCWVAVNGNGLDSLALVDGAQRAHLAIIRALMAAADVVLRLLLRRIGGQRPEAPSHERMAGT
jgi:CRISPR-associated protein Cas1